MRVGYLIICFLSVASHSFAQSLVDSLKRELRHVQGTARVDVLNQLTYECIGTDNKQALEFNEEAIALAGRINYPDGIGTANIYRGVYEYLSGENLVGIDYLRKGLEWVEKANDRNMVGYAYLQLGNSYMNLTHFDSSLANFNRAYEFLKDSANPVNLSKLYKNLGTLNGLKSSYKQQVMYLNRALAIREALGDPVLVADALVELGRLDASNYNFTAAEVYLSKAEKILQANPADLENLNDYRYAKALLLLHDTKFEEAFVMLDSARSFYERTSMLMKMITLHIDIGSIFMSRGEYEVALKNYYAALRYAESKGFLIQVMDIQVRLGWVNYALGEYQQALEFGNKSLVQAEQKNIADRKANAAMLLGVTYTQLKDFDKAEKSLKEALAIHTGNGNPALISESYVNLGYLREQQKDYNAARGYYNKGVELARKTDYWLGLAWSVSGLGNLAMATADYPLAAKLFDEAEGYAKKVQANEALIRIYESRRDLLMAQGKYKESLYFSILADRWKDSLHRNDLARRFTNLQKIDEIERRDRDIKVLEQERKLAQEQISYQQAVLNQQYVLIAAAATGLALLTLIAIVYARFYFKIKRLHKLIKEKNESIQLQSDKLREANQELGKLYREVMEQKEEIQAQSEELAESYVHVSTINQSLQDLVDEKTRDLLKTNEELIKQNNELLQFSYTVSHNLRGPVARLLGLSDLMLSPVSPQERDIFVQLIHKTSQDLDSVMRDLSKIIDVRNELHHVKERVDLEVEWNKCCDLVRDSIPQSATIRMDFRVREIFTIRAMIHSIFYNLLSNAIKYKSQARDLVITGGTKYENGLIRIDFEDNGLGIDLNKYQSSLFKLFKRFHTHVEGRGLGLYLIKSQIESLNGTIQVFSKVDQGTHFIVLIPEVWVPDGSEVQQVTSVLG